MQPSFSKKFFKIAIAPLALASSFAYAQVNLYVADQLVDGDGQSNDAIAVENGRVIARSSLKALQKQYPKASLTQFEGTLMPGLIDGHGHVLGMGQMLSSVDLSEATSLQDALDRVKAFADANPDLEWIVGGRWDQNDWPSKQFPTAKDLDSVVADRPVWLSRVDGHASWGNSKALSFAKKDLSGTWQPVGGQIIRDGKGLPSGVFIDAAEPLIADHIPQPSEKALDATYRASVDYLVSLGITGVHDAGVSLRQLKSMMRLADRGQLPLRIYAMADGNGKALAALCEQGPYHHASQRLSMRSVKVYLDGALGSRGAALRADYSDDPGNKGLMFMQPEELQGLLSTANGCQLQINAHAIGDAANELLIDSIAALPKQTIDTRHRIEHAQVVDDAMIDVMSKSGIVASMQPTHATSDMPWVGDRLGHERLKGAYAWQTMLDQGVKMVFGSDFPVERAHPFEGIYAAATRQDRQGSPSGGWYPEQKVSLDDAVKGFTRWAAWGEFAEGRLGDLKPGYAADFIVVNNLDYKNLESLLKVTVQKTYVDGQVVYSAQ